MTHRQHHLLRLLRTAAAPMTSAVLAERLGVSARSIIKDVAEINSAAEGMILSSKDGYTLNRSVQNNHAAISTDVCSPLPHTQKERLHYIIRRLLLGEKDHPELYLLADELHLSLDSIKKDIGQLQKELSHTSLSIHTTAGRLVMDGEEADKRNLLSESVAAYLSDGRLSLEGIQRVFRHFSVKSLHTALIETTQEEGMFVNDSLWTSLLQDILVTLSRIRLGHALPPREETAEMPPAATAVAKRIEEVCALTLTAEERSHLENILFSYWLPINFKEMDHALLLSMLPAPTREIWIALFHRLKETFPFLELSERFRVLVAMNLHNMLRRKDMGRRTLNPQCEDMKKASPFAFCLGKIICVELMRLTGKEFTEDDAAIFAVHIGLALQTQEHTRWENVTCSLFIPPYFDYDTELKDKILRHFQKDLHILADLQTTQDISTLKNVQLVISALPMPESSPVDWIVADPLLSRQNLQEIAYHIERKKKENRRKILRQFLVTHGQIGAIPRELQHSSERWLCIRHIALRLDAAPTVKTSCITIQTDKAAENFRGRRVNVLCHVALCPWEWEIVSYVLNIVVECLLSFPKIPWEQLTDMEKLIDQLEKSEGLTNFS